MVGGRTGVRKLAVGSPVGDVGAVAFSRGRCAGPTLACGTQPGDGARCAGADVECAVAAAGLPDVPRVGTKRSVGVAEDERGTTRARLIPSRLEAVLESLIAIA